MPTESVAFSSRVGWRIAIGEDRQSQQPTVSKLAESHELANKSYQEERSDALDYITLEWGQHFETNRSAKDGDFRETNRTRQSADDGAN